jgi:hypothetical protein
LEDEWYGVTREPSALVNARAALAQPEPQGPTDEELWSVGNDDFRTDCYPPDAIHFARAVLARWGRPKPPSLKEQALQALRHAPGPDYPNPITLLTADEHALIRRALEALPE